jgi:hypothetical protein
VRAAAGNAPAWKGRRMHRSRCLTGSCWLHGPCTPGTVAHPVNVLRWQLESTLAISR